MINVLKSRTIKKLMARNTQRNIVRDIPLVILTDIRPLKKGFLPSRYFVKTATLTEGSLAQSRPNPFMYGEVFSKISLPSWISFATVPNTKAGLGAKNPLSRVGRIPEEDFFTDWASAPSRIQFPVSSAIPRTEKIYCLATYLPWSEKYHFFAGSTGERLTHILPTLA